MTALNKSAKTDKYNHFGRGGAFLKRATAGIKGLDFFNASERLHLKRTLVKELDEEN